MFSVFRSKSNFLTSMVMPRRNYAIKVTQWHNKFVREKGNVQLGFLSIMGDFYERYHFSLY